MRRVMTVFLAASLLTGCTSRMGGKLGTAAGVGLMVFGFAMTQNALGHGGETDPANAAWVPVTLGMAIAMPSLYFALNGTDDDDRGQPGVAPPKVDRRAADRERAWTLTEQAEAAARVDDCATVARLDPQVSALDADLHDEVFAHDVAIARCLARSGL